MGSVLLQCKVRSVTKSRLLRSTKPFLDQRFPGIFVRCGRARASYPEARNIYHSAASVWKKLQRRRCCLLGWACWWVLVRLSLSKLFRMVLLCLSLQCSVGLDFFPLFAPFFPVGCPSVVSKQGLRGSFKSHHFKKTSIFWSVKPLSQHCFILLMVQKSFQKPPGMYNKALWMMWYLPYQLV